MYKNEESSERRSVQRKELPRARSNGTLRSYRESSQGRRTENPSPLELRLSTRDYLNQESTDYISSSNIASTVNTFDIDPYQKILLNFKKRPQSKFFRQIHQKAILNIDAL